jgi:hypothetical protein
MVETDNFHRPCKSSKFKTLKLLQQRYVVCGNFLDNDKKRRTGNRVLNNNSAPGS